MGTALLVTLRCTRAGCPVMTDVQYRPGIAGDSTVFCSTTCERRHARPLVPTSLPCPTAGCSLMIRKKGAPTCGPCWVTISGMCKGKLRQTYVDAFETELATDRVARECEVCKAWHNVGSLRSDDRELRQTVRAVLAGMVRTRGQEWVDALVEDWDPVTGSADRQAWRRIRQARRQHLQPA